MRLIIFSLPIAIFGLQMAFGGMRHPIEETGEQARAVENTVIESRTSVATHTTAVSGKQTSAAGHQAAESHAGKMASDRHVATPAAAPKYKFIMPRPSVGGATPPTAPSAHSAIPRAPGLPEAKQMNLGNVQLPYGQGVTVFRDALPVIEFKGRDRSERMHTYSRQARMLPLPKQDHAAEVRSRAIVEKYQAALSPVPFHSIRTPLQLHLDTLAKITLPSRPAAFRNMVKRIDALFDGVESNYPRGVAALWELSRSRLNPEELRARDSLFSGILSARAGWESVAASEFEASASQEIQEQDRYVQIIWTQMDKFENTMNVDRVVNHFDVAALEELQPVGNKANFSLAKKALREKDRERASKFAANISSVALRDRFDLLRAISTLQPREKASEETKSTLQNLADNGDNGVRDEARLALARALLRQGSTQDSLTQYQAIEKNGVNRLEVMSEQSYVEFLTGNHPEALGKAIGAESKYFQYGFSPDIHMVETLSRKATCDFGGAEAALQRFANRYVPELNGLDGVLQSKKEPAEYYDELISYHELKEPLRFQRYLLRLPVVMENQKLMNLAEKDLHKIDTLGIDRRMIERPQGWDTFASAMRANWEKRLPELKKQSGESALAEAAYMAGRLRQNFAQAELMGLDLATNAAKDYNLQNALNFPVRKLAATEPQKNQVLWPFEQEIWEDELDSLRMKNPSKCALANTLKPAL